MKFRAVVAGLFTVGGTVLLIDAIGTAWHGAITKHALNRPLVDLWLAILSIGAPWYLSKALPKSVRRVNKLLNP